MEQVPKQQVLKRLQSENPWWETGKLPATYSDWRPRPYLDLFLPLVARRAVRRAVVLMGPRRVGKTVLLHHTIGKLLKAGSDPRRIAYFSVDHPIYTGLGLNDLLDRFQEATGTDPATTPVWVFFDEIQYLREWEVHLKTLVDGFPQVRAVASGSAAAALRLKSDESGAGRFTDFLLPPLTFYEYLDLLDKTELARVEESASGSTIGEVPDIEALNTSFVDYLNFGGYPEVIFSEEIQADPGRFVKADIVDKVLLRDLPSLYGIQDIQELNYLFTTLAFNTASELSLEELSKSSGVAKNTIKRYIEYLESAFLIRILHRIDRSAKRFKRARTFKVYLTNPSIRAALFAPIDLDDPKIGAVVETAVFAQWFHAEAQSLYYARWKKGEVDLVGLGPTARIEGVVETKWTDAPFRHPERELASLLSFCRANDHPAALVTTRTRSGEATLGDVTLRFVPSSLYCYLVGRNLIRERSGSILRDLLQSAPDRGDAPPVS